MANNYDRTIKSSLHIESLNKIAKHLRLACRDLETTVNYLRADYAGMGIEPGAALDDVCYILSTLSTINDGWEQSKRGLYVEAAHDLLGTGAPVRKAAPFKVTTARRRSSAGSLVGGEAAESQKAEVRRQK